jgi:hypothetical protein
LKTVWARSEFPDIIEESGRAYGFFEGCQMNAIAFLLLSRLGFFPALALSADTPLATPQPMTFTGKVVTLAEALKGIGVAFDPEPVAKQVVVLGYDGTITPLLSDDASRAFFQDERLRNRRAELKTKQFPGLPYLQVVSFRVEDHGKLKTPEYYCDVCSISVRYPIICPCCQGPMVLQMKPDSP